jgi:hypothetical protein
VAYFSQRNCRGAAGIFRSFWMIFYPFHNLEFTQIF